MINLKKLNASAKTLHFKMKSRHSLKDVLIHNKYMAKMDLYDVYLPIEVYMLVCIVDYGQSFTHS